MMFEKGDKVIFKPNGLVYSVVHCDGSQTEIGTEIYFAGYEGKVGWKKYSFFVNTWQCEIHKTKFTQQKSEGVKMGSYISDPLEEAQAKIEELETKIEQLNEELSATNHMLNDAADGLKVLVDGDIGIEAEQIRCRMETAEAEVRVLKGQCIEASRLLLPRNGCKQCLWTGELEFVLCKDCDQHGNCEEYILNEKLKAVGETA